MPAFVDLTGRRFGRLAVISRAPNDARNVVRWHCECDCGETISAYRGNLLRAKTTSCGCFFTEQLRARVTTHGKTKSRTYRSWAAMIARCTNPSEPGYANYGGRGIGVCDRWRKFENFLADMGERPPELSLDRYPDHNGNYEPGNCRWATWVQQQRNKRSTRLCEGDAERIRDFGACGSRTTEIACWFNVSESAVKHVLRGDVWRPENQYAGYPVTSL